METDSFQQNIDGVKNLVDSDINKNPTENTNETEEPTDAFKVSLSDAELLKLTKEWQDKHDRYYPKIKERAKRNKEYYAGKELDTGGNYDRIVSSNLIFEAQETFIPQALAKNPQPVVWSDNTAEGIKASNEIKTMLQFKADTFGLRKKLAIVLRHWSNYFIGIIKYGWDDKSKDFTIQVRNPANFIWDPDAYISETGRYIGEFLGEKYKITAEKLIEKFPDKKTDIVLKTKGALGTKVYYTEWWTDEYCFYTFGDIVLDKHKNEFFNYDLEEQHTEEEQIKYGYEARSVTPGKNHFSVPIMPYSFFSVFSLQEQPHDITNLVEQAIPSQDRIVSRDQQIDKNLKRSNNSIALSGQSFSVETGRQAAQAMEDGDPVLVPDGQVQNAINRFPAPPLPNGLLESQNIDKQTLRQIFGTQGLTAEKSTSQNTARGLILNQNKDASRIGGGIGESLEQLADSVFNWMLQLMYVFYDEPHYAGILGMGESIAFVQITNQNINRQFVVSVSPNSMSPKDEISEQNQAIALANAGWLDPLTLLQKLNFPDPFETAQKVVLWKVAPQLYLQQVLQQQPAMPQPQTPQGQIPGQQPQEAEISGAQIPAPEVLKQVPLK